MAEVTIIVPIYNVEKYLPKCLDSLINQTFKDIEIWAISDGSPDNSIDIIHRYEKKDNRIKCIEKENGWYGSVLEYAINNISSPFFLICDPDDWLNQEAIEKLYKAAIGNNLDFVRAGYYTTFSDGSKDEYNDGIIMPEIFNPEFDKVYDEEINRFLFLTESPHSKLFKTNIAKGIYFPHKVSFTDGLLYKLYIPKIKNAMILKDALSYYLIDREGNTATDFKPKIADQHKIVFDSTMEQYAKYENKDDMFYYRMLLQCEFVNFQVCNIRDRKAFLEKRELVFDMYKSCMKYKKEIKKCFKYESFRRKLVFSLILNPLTSKTILKYISNRVWKRNAGKI